MFNSSEIIIINLIQVEYLEIVNVNGILKTKYLVFLRNLLEGILVMIILRGDISRCQFRICPGDWRWTVYIPKAVWPTSIWHGVDVVGQTGDLERGVGPVKLEIESVLAGVGHGRVDAWRSCGVEDLRLEPDTRLVRRGGSALGPFWQQENKI